MPRAPDTIKAVLFDVDGVLTDTARVHAKAWKEAFDEALERLGDDRPFDTGEDYRTYVDGKSRLDGVRSFLHDGRGHDVPEGGEDDEPGELTVHGIGRRKNDLVVALIEEEGVEAFPGARDCVCAARERGLRTAVVSSSANARPALRSAGLEELFDTWVDGIRIAEEELPGKPAPDVFLAAAADLGVEPGHAAVLEDALSGVEAGRAGEFGWVVGVDRTDDADALREHGADVVVQDLSEVDFA